MSNDYTDIDNLFRFQFERIELEYVRAMEAGFPSAAVIAVSVESELGRKIVKTLFPQSDLSQVASEDKFATAIFSIEHDGFFTDLVAWVSPDLKPELEAPPDQPAFAVLAVAGGLAKIRWIPIP